MIEIDGSIGGGQLLRTALALSVITQEPIRITDIRGGRSNPGLRPQHLTAVRLLADISEASVSEVEVGSAELEFDPAPPDGGSYEATIGTAGSITLLFDTALPLATVIDEPLTIHAQGGTDVKWSPPMDFFRYVKLPLLRRAGLQAAVDVDHWGFYPAGGGEARLHLAPTTLRSIQLPGRGELDGARLYSKCSSTLADRDVAVRQLEAAVERLSGSGVAINEQSIATARTDSPGSAIVIRLDCTDSIAGFSALGERGKPAEDVGESAADRVRAFVDEVGAVDRYLGDQLIVFLALTDGTVSVPELTEHISTSLELIEAFDLSVEVDESGAAPRLISRSASL